MMLLYSGHGSLLTLNSYYQYEMTIGLAQLNTVVRHVQGILSFNTNTASGWCHMPFNVRMGD